MTAHIPVTAVAAEETEKFRLDLRRAHRLHGEPSYRQLARTTKYSVATINRALNGPKLPSWVLTETFLTACGVTEDDLAAWRHRWATIAELIDPLDTTSDTEPAHQPDSAIECPDCGALIGNLSRHRRWHVQLDQRPRRGLRGLRSVG